MIADSLAESTFRIISFLLASSQNRKIQIFTIRSRRLASDPLKQSVKLAVAKLAAVVVTVPAIVALIFGSRMIMIFAQASQ